MRKQLVGLGLVLLAAQIAAAQGVCVNGQCSFGGQAGVYAGGGFPGGYSYGGYGGETFAPRICFTFEEAGGFGYRSVPVCFELPYAPVQPLYGNGYLPQQQYVPALSPGFAPQNHRWAPRERLVIRYRTR
jgi:hypothetical protein